METIQQDHFYHIYNRGIDGSVIFKSEDNMNYFLDLVKKHLESKVDILCYCLLNNHFHFVVEIKSEPKSASQAFSNLFNSYAKAFNLQNDRTGTLFERPFKRKLINDEDYLLQLILYIHKNPQNHNLTDDFSRYPYSSYQEYITDINFLIRDKSYIISLFEDLENFKYVHNHKFKNNNSKTFEESMIIENTISENLIEIDIKNLKTRFQTYIQSLQDEICTQIEQIDGRATFKEDIWKREEGGGGRSRIIENGAVFEKGGVNISAVHGELPFSMQQYFKVKDADFFACGLSLVLHPNNPMAPTVHANWRYFEMYDKKGNIVDQWFGGGQDLTPYYLFKEDAVHFHQTCKDVCDRHHPDFYDTYKKQCDNYFWNSHRDEARGVGGLFFDYCKKTDEMSMQDWYDFVTDVGDSFLDAYVPIIEKRKGLSYTEEQRNWQEIRRGRYVEFNLVHDKGTLFGLKTNGRIESILMSLPPKVQWVYNRQPVAGSEEDKLINILKNPIDWV